MPDARVRDRDLAGIWDEVNQDVKLRQIKKYLRGRHWPEATALWHLGEALNTCGITWSSGLWMLWIGGRFIDCVGVVMQYASIQRHARPIRRVLEMLAASTATTVRTELDLLQPFSQYYVGKSNLDDETTSDIIAWMRARDFRTFRSEDFMDRADAEDKAAKTAYYFVRREVAKSLIRMDESTRQTLRQAYEGWNEQTRTIDGDNFLVESAFDAAGATSINIYRREPMILALLSRVFVGEPFRGPKDALFPFDPLGSLRQLIPADAVMPHQQSDLSLYGSETSRLLTRIREEPLMKGILR